jgi:putative ATPase
MLVSRAGGDARVALAALDRAVQSAQEAGQDAIGVRQIEDALQRKALLYDREGDKHYDYISAWIKATRGSNVDASLYYLAVMLEGGEDPRFIARRMVILASEDVGNADPQALVVANAAADAVDRVGLPECRLNLAQAAAYLALAPKSNASYEAIKAATREVREHGAQPPPPYLQDAHYPGAKLGRGTGYRYPHDESGGITDQELMPRGLEGERFYEPTDRGFEATLRERLDALRRALGRGRD